MNHREFFANYQNVLDFYASLLKFDGETITKYHERVKLMFDLDEIFCSKELTIGEKHEFLKSRASYKQLLNELTDFYIISSRDFRN